MRLPMGNHESALCEYLDPTGKRSAVKVACCVWSRGKIARSYLSLEFTDRETAVRLVPP